MEVIINKDFQEMFYLYAVLMYCLYPIARVYWYLRSRKDSRYNQRISERLGYQYQAQPADVWIHAASVGESKIAVQIASILQRKGYSLLLTTMTPNGSDIITQALGETVQHVYAPYDRFDCVSRFISAFQPKVCFLVETELWPGWLWKCRQLKILVWLINARCNPKSFRDYSRLQKLWPFVSYLSGVIASSPTDAARFEDLGAPNVSVVPNLKWSLPIQPKIAVNVPCVCAGSFHRDEVEALIAAWASSPMKSTWRLVIAPRHLTYLNEIDALLEKHSLKDIGDQDAPGITVVRDMGVLMSYYQTASIVIVGGSYIEHGGHNPLEPASFAVPVIMGLSTYNFEQPVASLKACGALKQTSDIPSALALASMWMSDSEMATKAQLGARDCMQEFATVKDQYINKFEIILGEIKHRDALCKT